MSISTRPAWRGRLCDGPLVKSLADIVGSELHDAEGADAARLLAARALCNLSREPAAAPLLLDRHVAAALFHAASRAPCGPPAESHHRAAGRPAELRVAEYATSALHRARMHWASAAETPEPAAAEMDAELAARAFSEWKRRNAPARIDAASRRCDDLLSQLGKLVVSES